MKGSNEDHSNTTVSMAAVPKIKERELTWRPATLLVFLRRRHGRAVQHLGEPVGA